MCIEREIFRDVYFSKKSSVSVFSFAANSWCFSQSLIGDISG